MRPVRSSPPAPRPPRRARPRLAVAAAVALLLAAGARPAAAAPAAPPHVVQDPAWGEVLFQFYQDRYFTALVELEADRARGRLPHHDDEAEVLRGGLLLSYGMHRQAGEIFEQLIARHAPPAVQDRAWFFLAKIRYQRGLDAEAEAAIDRVQGRLPDALEDQRQLLHAQLLMAREDWAGATRVLDALVKSSQHAGFFGRSAGNLFARYNLGVARIRAGQSAEGTAVLDALGTMPGPDEETRALRDRANVALGFAALQDNRPADARRYLERVRLQGPSANKALLGFGWAAASLKQYDLALAPWNELAARDPDDAAVLEARIAAPYAYGELGARGQALHRYQDAIAAFDTEDRQLDESIAALRQGSLVQALAARNPQAGMGWFQGVDRLPSAVPHPSHLAGVLAGHDFQEGFKNWRDLRFLAGNLDDWQERLGVYDQMLANRRSGYADRLPQVLRQEGTLDVDALQRRHDALAAQAGQAARDGDGRALASDTERALMARAERAQATLSRLQASRAADPTLPTAAERLRRVQGALAWQLAEAQPGRLWDVQKGLKATEDGLAEARRHQDEIARAQREEPARFAALADRIADLKRRVAALQPRVAALSGEQQAALQGLAVEALRSQKERLAGYTAQARFAVAQLYDQAMRASAGGGDPAAAPPAPGAASPSAPANAPAPAPAPAPAAHPASPLGLQEDAHGAR